MKVVCKNGPALVIGQGRSGRTVPPALNAMAFPALHPVEYFLAGLDSVRRDFWFWRNLNWFSWFLILKARGEMLDVGDQVRTLLVGERIPLRHVGSDQAASNRVKQIFVGGV